MNQSELKKFAQNTRRKLLKQIGNRLEYILNHDDPYLRAHKKEKTKIKGLLDKKGKEQLVEETAYIWFNRLTALRFMDNRGYNRILIVSPLEGESQPNILSEIKQGKFPEEISGVKQSVYDYIDGKIDTNDPDREAYKITLLAWCNYLGSAMPYLFEKIDDWAALLLPLDLLSEESIITNIQKGIQKEDCKDVEVIGWLYQYYISEKKDEVFAGLKKNVKITKANIPAATQLFTPEWIVRYMVENSLGRLWLNNFPGSSLKGSMEYFVEGGEEVDSSEYGVDSKDRSTDVLQSSLNTNYSLLTTDANSNAKSIGERDGDTQLSRINRVAEGDGAGQRGLFDNQGVSEGGNLFSDESDTKGSSIDSFKYSRGRGEKIEGGLSSIPEHSQGISGRSGNTDRSSSDVELYKERAGKQYSEPLYRNEQTVNRTSEKSEEVGGREVVSREYIVDSKGKKEAVSQSSLNTNYSLLNTNNNYSLPTTIHISEPTEIKLIDPSCGSGHILVYAFDILYKIYEEEGYTIADIPSLILKNNLFGVDIDDRAAALSAFALAMKAREKDRFFFDRGVVPNIIASQEVDVNSGDVSGITFSEELKRSFDYLKDAKNLGSLIPVSGGIAGEITTLKEKIEGLSSDDFFEMDKIEQLKDGLKQLEYLSPQYHCVITNPPYMGGLGMSKEIKDFVGKEYKDYKSDLFSAFFIRCLNMGISGSYLGFMSPFVWMFISSYEKLRNFFINEHTITSLIQLEYSGFAGATVPICTFTLKKGNEDSFKGAYIRLSDFRGSEKQGPKTLEAIKDPNCGWFFTAKASDFLKIPGCPIAYWASKIIRVAFAKGELLRVLADPKKGLATTDNGRFLRYWFEITNRNIGIGYSNRNDVKNSGKKWFPLNKGGGFRKWYGNKEYVINWKDDGYEIKNAVIERYGGGSYTKEIRSESKYFKDGITWSALTSNNSSFRLTDYGAIFDSAGSTMVPKSYQYTLLGLLNTPIVRKILSIINPTLNFGAGTISNIPVLLPSDSQILNKLINKLVDLSQRDWDSYETSWDFTKPLLLKSNCHQSTLENIYKNLRFKWNDMVLEMQRIEEENNSIFIETYGLQDELTPKVLPNEITLTCNPYYRYGVNKSEDILENLLLTDTMKELISYGVGCTLGRYSLNKDGLILANAGEGLADYLKQIPEPTFTPGKSGILPITDENDFTDDLPSQFKTFLKASFGPENFQENLRFVEEAIGKDIRTYFIKDFYKDHAKRYKKRPIYWMLSSPSGAFRALIYLHRYTKDTIGVFLNDYLRQYKKKLEAKIKFAEQTIISGSASSSDKTTAQKDIDKIYKILKELETWERDVVYPLALKRVELDLDDGVKVNYGKLGDVLETVKGLNG